MANTNSTCISDECERKVLARGMCSTHYSYWHRNKAMYPRVCEWCSAEFMAPRASSVFCTTLCMNRYANTLANEGRRKSTALVVKAKPRVWLGQTMPARKGPALVSGPCPYCGHNYTALSGTAYCSDRCKNNAKQKRKYDMRGEFKVTDLMRHEIYKRDAFTCQLCYLPVDIELNYVHAMSATLDHIIPQSWMLIPDHSPANLRLAHRACNSARGAQADAA